MTSKRDYELDRRVAEALGYKIEPAEWMIPDEMGENPQRAYYLADPQGNFVSVDSVYVSRLWWEVPRFSVDINEAIKLLDALPDLWLLKKGIVLLPARQYIVEIYRPDGDGNMNVISSGRAYSPAVAICEAWLSYKYR